MVATPAGAVIIAAIELTRFALKSIEAAQVGDIDEAKALLAKARDSVRAAEAAWEAAG